MGDLCACSRRRTSPLSKGSFWGWPAGQGAGQRLDCSKLLVKRHEIKVVPGLNDLSVLNPHDRHSRDFHGSVGGSKSKAVARVFTAHQTTRCDFVVFADGVFDRDHDIGESLAKLRMKFLETGRSAQRITTVEDTISEHDKIAARCLVR